MAAKPPYMQWYCRDWVADLAVQSMDPVARCGYFEILNRMWMAGAVLSDDDKTLQTASTLTKKMWLRHRNSILEMLLQASPGMTAGIPGEYRGVPTPYPAVSQKRLLREYEHASKVLEAKARGGKNRQDSSRSLPGLFKDSTQDSSRTPPANPEAEADSSLLRNSEDVSVSKETSPPKSPSKTPVWGERFDEWWSIWPSGRKTAKADALKAYGQVIVQGKAPGLSTRTTPDKFTERHERLMETTPLWVEREFSGRESDVIPYPATFLRRLDWLEAPAEPIAAKKRTIFDELAERRAAQGVVNAH